MRPFWWMVSFCCLTDVRRSTIFLRHHAPPRLQSHFNYDAGRLSVFASFFHRLQCSTARVYSDSRLGVRFVIAGIESVRSVFKAITASRNAASPIQFSQRKTVPETAMGEMGVKATIIGRNPVARRYWPARTA